MGVLTCFLISSVEAEPRYVDLLAELKSSRIVAPCRITSYDKDGLHCELSREPRSKFVFKYSDDPKWMPHISTDSSSVGTEIWPPVNASVVVVVGKDNIVSLFALAQNAMWRFWSPVMTGSTAIFECRPPSSVIKLVHGQKDSEKYKSWDGCMLSSQDLEGFYKW